MGMCMFMLIWASCVDVRVFVRVYTNDCVYLWLCVFFTMYMYVYIYVHKHNMGMCMFMLNWAGCVDVHLFVYVCVYTQI